MCDEYALLGERGRCVECRKMVQQGDGLAGICLQALCEKQLLLMCMCLQRWQMNLIDVWSLHQRLAPGCHLWLSDKGLGWR